MPAGVGAKADSCDWVFTSAAAACLAVHEDTGTCHARSTSADDCAGVQWATLTLPLPPPRHDLLLLCLMSAPGLGGLAAALIRAYLECP